MLRREGYTLRQVAALWGISVQRVHQISIAARRCGYGGVALERDRAEHPNGSH